MLLSNSIVDFHLFYDGAVDIQIWDLSTRSQCKVCDTQVTVKACGPLVFFMSTIVFMNKINSLIFISEIWFFDMKKKRNRGNILEITNLLFWYQKFECFIANSCVFSVSRNGIHHFLISENSTSQENEFLI